VKHQSFPFKFKTLPLSSNNFTAILSILTGPKYVLEMFCNDPLNSTNKEPVGTPVEVLTGIIARISEDVGAFAK
jgi:hypothetical protein